jgi:hypothetical protein
MTEKSIYLLLAVFGFAITFALSFASEREEAWDHWTYFAIGIPAMALAAGIAGYHRPHLTWSLGFAVVAGSLAWMLAATGIGSMLVAGLWFGAVIGLLCSVAAWLGSKLRQRRQF